METEEANGHTVVTGRTSLSSLPEKVFVEVATGPSPNSPIGSVSPSGNNLQGSLVKVEVDGDEEEEEEGEEDPILVHDYLDNGLEHAPVGDDISAEGFAGAWAEHRSFGSPGCPMIQGSAPGGLSRLPSNKLTCEICGMVCIGPNVLMVHKRSHTGERPFQCNQCGASFTQKGNLLRHVKLHTDEKPFKCSLCSYACRRRDALMGHIRTHSVGKPYKCNFCSRSYKQRSSLEEHQERCPGFHQGLPSSHLAENAFSKYGTTTERTDWEHGSESFPIANYLRTGSPVIRTRDFDLYTLQTVIRPGQEPPLLDDSALLPTDVRLGLDPAIETLIEPGFDKLSNLDRFSNNFQAKRKSSTPQKVFGQKRMQLELSDIHYDQATSSLSERLHEVPGPVCAQTLEPSASVFLNTPSPVTRSAGQALEATRRLESESPGLPSDIGSIVRPVYSQSVDNRFQHDSPLSTSRSGLSQQPGRHHPSPGILGGSLGGICGRPAEAVGDSRPVNMPPGRGVTSSPSNSCPDSTDTESSHEERSHHRTGSGSSTSRPNGSTGRPHRPEMHQDNGRLNRVSGASDSSSLPTYNVSGSDGEALRTYPCHHCGLLFLDHVMYTLHMGCHGFRDPFECNVCGYRSRDRYEFSSHIIRGEHLPTAE
uniref:ikaros family zinc finger protein isoform X2 n=1 Tax=Myxine glutinosa TaxID=7769 RepID=UPI00358FA35A